METKVMRETKDLFQTADWKKEKHIPVIEVKDPVKKGEMFRIRVTVGKEIPHPNTTEHNIMWIELYFQPAGEKFPYQIARVDFSAHGASTDGPNTSTVFTCPEVEVTIKTDKPGILFAASHCNIHGLWQSSVELKVV